MFLFCSTGGSGESRGQEIERERERERGREERVRGENESETLFQNDCFLHARTRMILFFIIFFSRYQASTSPKLLLELVLGPGYTRQ